MLIGSRMNKTFPVQLNEELHKRLKHAAIDEGITLHDWIIKVLEQKVAAERINANKLVKRKNDSGR